MLHSLHHVCLAVPDLEVGRRFYTTMGLQARTLADGLAFQCAGRMQDQVRLVEGPKKRIAYVSFGTSPAGLAQIAERLAANGIARIDAPVRDNTDGLWFRDIDGDVVNVRAAEPAPQTRAPVALNNAGDFRRLGRRGAPNRDIEATPLRLGHLLKFTTNVQRTIDFYTGTLGMKLSDRIGELAAFLRFGGDSDHHTLAIAASSAPGLHHMSFELGNLDRIQMLAARMIEAGYRDAWGVGRHIYGSNYFHYIHDPWGSLVEFFWDIDFIPGDAHWEVENAEAGPDALYQWATMPPPETFLHNTELAAQ